MSFSKSKPYETLSALLIALFCILPQLAKAEYRLREGDMLGISFFGIPEANAEIMVDPDGGVWVPLIGSVEATGRTLSEFNEIMKLRSLGVSVRLFGRDGAPIVDMSEIDVHADIVDYSPVYVSGQVLRPGQVDFRPGMSIRAAITKAGGASAFPELGNSGVISLINRMTNQRKTALELASTLADIWRIEATLAGDIYLPTPAVDNLPISPEKFEQLIEQARFRASQSIEEHLRRIDHFVDEEALLLELTDRLEDMRDDRSALLNLNQEQTERATNLSERGLIQLNRVFDARRMLALSNAQLTDMEVRMTQVETEKLTVSRERAKYESEYRTNILAERSRILGAMDGLQIELDGITALLAGQITSPSAFDRAAHPKLAVELIRDGQSFSVPGDLSLDDPVSPQDVLRVSRGE